MKDISKKITLTFISIIVVVFLFGLTSFIQAANNVWDNSDADNDGNNPNNWSLGWVPTAGDTMYFDNTSDANCTFSGAISTDAINVTADYDGIIDFNDFAITTSGNQTYDGAGTVDCGASTITCSGNFDNKDQTIWTYGTSTLIMDGTAGTETIISHDKKDLYNLIITGTLITVHPDTIALVEVNNNLVVNGTLLLNDFLKVSQGSVSGTGTISSDATLNRLHLTVSTINGSGLTYTANTLSERDNR